LLAGFFIGAMVYFDLINPEFEGHCLYHSALQVFIQESEDAAWQGRVVIKSLYYAVPLGAGEDGVVSDFWPYTTLTL
jgi:hypothetical protein